MTMASKVRGCDRLTVWVLLSLTTDAIAGMGNTQGSSFDTKNMTNLRGSRPGVAVNETMTPDPANESSRSVPANQSLKSTPATLSTTYCDWGNCGFQYQTDTNYNDCDQSWKCDQSEESTPCGCLSACERNPRCVTWVWEMDSHKCWQKPSHEHNKKYHPQRVSGDKWGCHGLV